MDKTCSQCKECKPATSEHFPQVKIKGSVFGLRCGSWCRKCVARKTKEYNAKHPDKRRSRDQAYRERTLETRRAYARRYGKEYNARDAVKTWKREHHRKLKREALEHYGGAFCKCCGEDEILMLALDHIASDGAEHRRSLTGTSRALPIQSYIWAKKNGWPPIFQVMCFNCNMARHWSPDKKCPHEIARHKLTLVTSACQAAQTDREQVAA